MELLHARHLLTAATERDVTVEVREILHRLDDLTVESPVAMLGELDRVRRHSEDLLALAVRHARSLGLTWAHVAEALGTTEETVHRRYGSPE